MTKSTLFVLFSAAVFTFAITLAKPRAANSATTEPTDRDTECVRRFYDLMLQQGEPTAEEEAEIFDTTQPWIEKLQEMHALPEGKTTLMRWFRDNKTLFLPKHMSRKKEIFLTSGFRYVDTLEGPRPHVNKKFSFVLCSFVNDRTLPYAQQKQIWVVFQLLDGKISPDSIQPDGIASEGTELIWTGMKGK